MKHQTLISWKDKSKKIEMSSASVVIGALVICQSRLQQTTFIGTFSLFSAKIRLAISCESSV